MSGLPGNYLGIAPEGSKCRDCDRSATRTVQGETDSSGCEILFFCEDCYKKLRNAPLPSGHCDWCGEEVGKLVTRRDYTEGLDGPIYRVCFKCVKVANEEDARYLEEERM